MSFALLIAILLGTIVAVALLAWVATAIALLIIRGAGAVVRRALRHNYREGTNGQA